MFLGHRSPVRMACALLDIFLISFDGLEKEREFHWMIFKVGIIVAIFICTFPAIAPSARRFFFCFSFRLFSLLTFFSFLWGLTASSGDPLSVDHWLYPKFVLLFYQLLNFWSGTFWAYCLNYLYLKKSNATFSILSSVVISQSFWF